MIKIMKLFTTINMKFGGVVREIGAENLGLVEYGNILFVLEADQEEPREFRLRKMERY